MNGPSTRWWILFGLVAVGGLASTELAFQGGEVDVSRRLEGPSWDHPLGTDQLGRDVVQRLAAGGIVSLSGATFALVATGLLGTTLGVWAGWVGGRFADLLTAIIDALVAIPSVVVALVVVSLLQPGTFGLVIAMTAMGWLPFARLALRLTSQEITMEYVEAARFSEASSFRVLSRTVLPNVARPLLAHSVLRFPGKLILFSGLSFLGLGPQPPSPEWGAMLAQGVAELERTPMLVLAPGGCITIAGVLVATYGRRLEASATKQSS